MEDKESQVIKMSILYKLRLIFSQGGKKEYTTDEIVELIDRMAIEKDFQNYKWWRGITFIVLTKRIKTMLTD